MRRLLIGILLLLSCVGSRPNAQAQSDPVSEVIQRVNALRAAYGVPPYQIDSALMAAAQAQASWSAANDHIGHDGPGGSTPNERAQAAGYGNGYRSYATENAAHGTAVYNTPERVVTMWQGDAVHLNALISADYEHIGVGYAEANGESWYVLMAGWVADGAASGQPQAPQTAAAPAPYIPFNVAEPDETGAIYHEVQPGQTAWTIAAYYEMDLAALLAQNNLTEESFLHPGERLLIRPPDVPTSTPTPTVLPTDLPPTATAVPPEPTTQPTIQPTNQPTPTPTPPPAEPAKSSSTLIIGLGLVLLVVFIAIISLRK
ncbi:MAG: LysM peptidoglycan-binding domain-containing protein [Ardenticatenaceae bacterium]|nr:LysM peptidoglycan-binding domain-containing protein [Ardenticatenaceae bacterium]MCB9446667.1 LysM peptidoglycan-binding domain-containing protein [Ardenticatenaceae bacterium]